MDLCQIFNVDDGVGTPLEMVVQLELELSCRMIATARQVLPLSNESPLSLPWSFSLHLLLISRLQPLTLESDV